MQAVGIECVIARSIADLYRENCLQNGLLPIELTDDLASNLEQRVIAADGQAPFSVDLTTQMISGPGGADIHFEIGAADRMRLLEGLDDIGLSLKHEAAIAAFERKMQQASPWLQRAMRTQGTEPSK
jgi:3-isopropylmalate dehydratase small subunit